MSQSKLTRGDYTGGDVMCRACGVWLPTCIDKTNWDYKGETIDDHMRKHHPDWVWTGKRYMPKAKGYFQNCECSYYTEEWKKRRTCTEEKP